MDDKDLCSIIFLTIYGLMFIICVIGYYLKQKELEKIPNDNFNEELLRKSWNSDIGMSYEEAMRKHCLELSQMMRRQGKYYNKG